MDAQAYRHELKYEIAYGEYIALYQRLRTVMQPDPHCGADGRYRITSLYFDNCRDRALWEKWIGARNRDKYRIRYYNDDTSIIHLEKKSKRGDLCMKKACVLTQDEVRRIQSGAIDGLGSVLERPLLAEFIGAWTHDGLRPKTVVSYTRAPLVYAPGNVRVTFDTDIRTALGHAALFDGAAEVPVTNRGRVILEVKFDAFLPEVIRQLLQSGSPRIGSFSKYAAGRSFES